MPVELMKVFAEMLSLIVLAPIFAAAVALFGIFIYMEWHYFLAWRKRTASPPAEPPVVAATVN